MNRRFLKEYTQIFIFSAFCAGLYFWTHHWAFLIVAGTVLLLGLWKPFRIFFLDKFNALTHFVGKIQSAILLSFIYLLVLYPLALIRRLFNRKAQSQNTFFTNREQKFSPQDFEKMW